MNGAVIERPNILKTEFSIGARLDPLLQRVAKLQADEFETVWKVHFLQKETLKIDILELYISFF